MQLDGLDRRFLRLRMVAGAWQARLQELPEQVVASFEANDLCSIAGLLDEKQRLERLIPAMQEFIQKWEEVAERDDQQHDTARA
jgi:hypothetical protein